MEYRKDMFQNLTTTSQSRTLRKSETTNLNATLHPNVSCVDIGMLRHGFMRFWTVRFQRMSVSHYIRIRLKTSWYFVIWCGILWKHEDKIGTDSIEWKGTLTVWGCKMTIFYKIYNRMFESSRSTAICVQWDKGVSKAKTESSRNCLPMMILEPLVWCSVIWNGCQEGILLVITMVMLLWQESKSNCWTEITASMRLKPHHFARITE